MLTFKNNTHLLTVTMLYNGWNSVNLKRQFLAQYFPSHRACYVDEKICRQLFSRFCIKNKPYVYWTSTETKTTPKCWTTLLSSQFDARTKRELDYCGSNCATRDIAMKTTSGHASVVFSTDFSDVSNRLTYCTSLNYNR